MAAALQNQLEHAGAYDDLAFMDRLNLLLDHENLTWQSRKQESFIRQASFKLHGTLLATALKNSFSP